jgi:hypothetical protein
MRPQNDCYIPALRPPGGAHPIGVWAHTREEATANHARLGLSTFNSRRREDEVLLSSGRRLATCGSKRRSKTPQPSQRPFSIVSIVRHVCDTIRLGLPIGRRM